MAASSTLVANDLEDSTNISNFELSISKSIHVIFAARSSYTRVLLP